MRLIVIKTSLKVLAGVLILLGCDNFADDGTAFSEIESQRAALSRTWNADQVIFNNVDITDQDNYRNFTITFDAEGAWNSENGAPIFLSGGTWEFAEGNVNVVNMDGTDVLIGFSIDKAQSRVLTLTISAEGNSIGTRVSGLTGEYIFRLSTLEE